MMLELLHLLGQYLIMHHLMKCYLQVFGEVKVLSYLIYLRSMSVHADSLFSLGPIVSAQRVNVHPVSSDSGIQF